MKLSSCPIRHLLVLEVLQPLDVYRVEVTVHVDDYRYCDSSLGCGHSYAEECKDVPFEMSGMAIGVEHGKVDVHSIEHKLGAYEQRYKITSCEKAEDSDEEEYCRQY